MRDKFVPSCIELRFNRMRYLTLSKVLWIYHFLLLILFLLDVIVLLQFFVEVRNNAFQGIVSVYAIGRYRIKTLHDTKIA